MLVYVVLCCCGWCWFVVVCVVDVGDVGVWCCLCYVGLCCVVRLYCCMLVRVVVLLLVVCVDVLIVC